MLAWCRGAVGCRVIGAQNFITREDIIAYAEEGGDFAQLKEVDAFMEVRARQPGESSHDNKMPAF